MINWDVSGHPWIIFYTERNLRSLSFKSKSKHQAGPSLHTAATTSLIELTRKITIDGTKVINNLSASLLTSRSSGRDDSEEQDDTGLVDALAVAISHVRISEPKRSRLCVPTSPIREQCSSVSTSNLCKAC